MADQLSASDVPAPAAVVLDAADAGEDVGGRPANAVPWGYLGLAGAAVSWLAFHWDISWHVDIGRDRFVTPPHLMIIAGIAIAAIAPTRAALAGLRGQDAGLAGTTNRLAIGVVLTGGALAFDNAWHGVFGQDVTIWAPAHLLLLLGFLAMLVGGLANLPEGALGGWRRPVAAGATMILVSILLQEYDQGIPHFGAVFEAPVMAVVLGMGVGMALTGAVGRWNVTRTAIVFAAARLVGIGFNAAIGRSAPAFPVALTAGAVVADLVAGALRESDGLEGAATGWRGQGGRRIAAAVAGWLAAASVVVGLGPLVGRTWWPRSVVAAAVLSGVAFAAVGTLWGAALARATGVASSDGPAAVRARRSRTLWLAATIAGLVAAGVLTGRPLLSDVGVTPTQALVADHGDQLAVAVAGGRPSGSVSILSLDRKASGTGTTLGTDGLGERRWVAGLTWHDAWYRGEVPDDLDVVVVWYVDGDISRMGVASLGEGGEPRATTLFPSALELGHQASGRWTLIVGTYLLYLLALAFVVPFLAQVGAPGPTDGRRRTAVSAVQWPVVVRCGVVGAVALVILTAVRPSAPDWPGRLGAPAFGTTTRLSQPERVDDGDLHAGDPVPLASGDAGSQVTISGDITTTNRGDELVMDVATLRRLGLYKGTIRDPYLGQRRPFVGVTLTDVLALAGAPNAEKLVVSAHNGHTATVSLREIDPGHMFLATEVDGTPLEHTQFAPMWLVYTVDSPDTRDPTTWVWNLGRIDVIR